MMTISRLMLPLIVLLAACQSTYDQGLAAAEQIVADIGVEPASGVSRPAADVPMSVSFQNSAFRQTIRDAVLSFPSLSGQQAGIQSAVAQMDAVVGNLRPQLISELDAGQTLVGGDDEAVAGVSLTARQLVFDGATTKRQIAQARINQLRQSFALDGLLSSLSQQMVLAWLNLWQQTQLERLAKEDVSAHQEFLDRTQARASGGVVAPSDVLPARSRLADANVRLARTQAAVGQAVANFTVLIGPAPATIAFPPTLPHLSADAARKKVPQSSQLTMVRLQLSRAISQRDVVVSQRYPEVFVDLTGSRDGILGGGPDHDVSIGFSVEHDFSTGGQQSAREREAQSGISSARAVVEEAELQLGQSLETALANREAARVEVDASAIAARSNRENLDVVREQFAIGRRSIVEILDAQRDLSQALSNEVTARARQVEIELEILTLTGDLAPVFGIDYDPYSAVLNGNDLTVGPPLSIDQ
ncbi:TolC family protein [uncultured Tateyamaria sp.]|uniref:TolC family protein n=1 Tax=uncultured Tateyamaria sp. TaxID=455651 RepID=UPI0026390970|nr:TolC family protein [uncultured Tateyamaria sp.]